MQSLKSIAEQILFTLKKVPVNSDTILLMILEKEILNARAKFLRRYLHNSNDYSSFTQTVYTKVYNSDSIEGIKLLSNYSDGFLDISNVKILISEYELPQRIRIKNNKLFYGISSISVKNSFKFIPIHPPERFAYSFIDRDSISYKCCVYNNRIYLGYSNFYDNAKNFILSNNIDSEEDEISVSDIDEIKIDAIFENPYLVKNYTSDKPLPISLDIKDDIINYILTNRVNIIMNNLQGESDIKDAVDTNE